MATSKLLKPTNVTISIPAFTDQPDQRVNSNCIDKEADAINSLSDQIVTYAPVYFCSQDFTSSNFPTIALPNDWDILYVTFYVQDYGNVFPFVVDKKAIDSSHDTVFRAGFYVSATDWARAHFGINSSRTSLTVRDSQINGNTRGGKIIISYFKFSA